MPPRHRPDVVQSPTETYLSEIGEISLLTADEEKELARRIAVGDNLARDRLIRANLRFVVNMARRYVGRGLPLQDLIEEGNLGLLNAAARFDPQVGTRFCTYASFWVKQSIHRALVDTARPVRIPTYLVPLVLKWRQTAAALEESLGRPATGNEIARVLKLPKKRQAIVEQAIKVQDLVPQTDRPEDGWSLGEALVDERTRAPDVEMVETEARDLAMARIEELEAREAAVLRMRFGLNEERALTLKAIGKSFGLTRERVRQIENEALGKLAALFQAG
jgi:RNA polymerase primary sigma factor